MAALLALTAFAAALSLAAADVRGRLPGDLAISYMVQTSLGAGWPARLLDLFDHIHEPPIIAAAIAFAVLLAVRRRWLEALAMVLLVLSAAEVALLKDLIARPRPTPDLITILDPGQGYSFPSGHAFVAITLLGGMAVYGPAVLGPRRWVAALWRAMLVVLIAAIALSRIHVGAHWPSDVAGSISIGLVTLVVVTYGVGRLQSGRPQAGGGQAGKRRGPSPVVPRGMGTRGER